MSSLSTGALRPYLSGAIGPAFGMTQGAFTGSGTVFAGSHSQATLFTQVGAGVDYFPARSFALGVSGGYNFLGNFSQPVGTLTNHSGPEIVFSFGWMFGRGRPLATTRTR